jgi:hypothetical protein
MLSVRRERATLAAFNIDSSREVLRPKEGLRMTILIYSAFFAVASFEASKLRGFVAFSTSTTADQHPQ